MGQRTKTAKPQTFKHKLVEQLETREMGVRTLARRLAGPNATPKAVEAARRRINRYIHEGISPTKTSRWEIEAAFEMERDTLKGDDEDDSRVRRPSASRQAEMFVDLIAEAVLTKMRASETVALEELQES